MDKVKGFIATAKGFIAKKTILNFVGKTKVYRWINARASKILELLLWFNYITYIILGAVFNEAFLEEEVPLLGALIGAIVGILPTFLSAIPYIMLMERLRKTKN